MKIKVQGHEFDVKMTGRFISDCAEQIDIFSKKASALADTEITDKNRIKLQQDSADACCEFLYFAFGRDNVLQSLNATFKNYEITAAELATFTSEAIEKLTAALPKQQNDVVKLK